MESSPADIEPDTISESSPTATPAIEKLWREIEQWCHPEHPFLDRSYSPSSDMPAIDYTLWIKDRLLENDEESVQQLMIHISSGSQTWKNYVHDFCAWRVPGFEQEPVLEAELRASMLLCYRTGGHNLPFQWKRIWTVVLAAHENLHSGSPLAAKMALCSPTLRIVVISEWPKGEDGLFKVDWSLGYGDRCYGNSSEWNQYYGDWLGVFEPPSADTPLHAGFLTKADLKEEAALQNVVISDKQKKERMHAEFIRHPELVAAVWSKYGAGLSLWNREIWPEVNEWALHHERCKERVPELAEEAALSFLAFQNSGLPEEARERLRAKVEIEKTDDPLQPFLDTPGDLALRLIFDTQSRLASGKRSYLEGLDPDSHNRNPALEIKSFEPEGIPPGWCLRWVVAGGPPLVRGCRFIAPKNHPVWHGLGDASLFGDALGVGYCPFWLGFDGHVVPVSRGTCEKLGILEKGVWSKTYFAPGCEIPASKPQPQPPISNEQRLKRIAMLKALLERNIASQCVGNAEEQQAARQQQHEAEQVQTQQFLAEMEAVADSVTDPETQVRIANWLTMMVKDDSPAS